jgi:hypothetical protein
MRSGLRCWCGGRPAEELLRRLVLPVLEHQAGGLRDDATLLLMQWTGTRPGGKPALTGTDGDPGGADGGTIAAPG